MLAKWKPREGWPRFAVASYGVLIDAFARNLPECSMELRLMLKMLVKAYYADL